MRSVVPQPAPRLEMLWESTDPLAALTSRFGFADADELAAWVTKVLADRWGVEVVSCDRVVISAGNALVWVTASTGRLILKWSVIEELFPRLANVARLTEWLDERGVPVSAPMPSSDGELQVELNGFSMGLQSVVEGSMLDVSDPSQVHAAGAALARVQLALADYPEPELGVGGQADASPLRARIEGWLETATGPHVAELAESLRGRSAALPVDEPSRQLVHLDVRSANMLWSGDQVVAFLDFEEAGVDFPVAELAKATVLLGTRFRQWGPVSVGTQAAFVAGYRSVRELTSVEEAWLGSLILLQTLQMIPDGDDPTGWKAAAGAL